MRKNGFTLVELLVVTAVIGVLGIVSASIMSSILRTQNKTAIINEVRQNGDLVISKFERDVKQSESVSGSGTSVTLRMYTGEQVTWDCFSADFTRDPDASGPLAALPIINTDPDNGVQVFAASCTFTVSTGGADVPQIVTLVFALEQRSLIQKSEYQVREQFQVTAGTRSY